MALELFLTGTNISVSASDIAADATFTVPDGALYEPTLVQVDYTSSADAGTRKPQLLVANGGANLLTLNPTPTQAASLTRTTSYFPFASASAAFVNTSYATWPLPPNFILPSGSTINAFDLAAIAPSADLVVLTVAYNMYIQVDR